MRMQGPIFDRIVVVDWSAASRPKLGSDSIWIAVLNRRTGGAPSAARRVQRRMGNLSPATAPSSLRENLTQGCSMRRSELRAEGTPLPPLHRRHRSLGGSRSQEPPSTGPKRQRKTVPGSQAEAGRRKRLGQAEQAAAVPLAVPHHLLDPDLTLQTRDLTLEG